MTMPTVSYVVTGYNRDSITVKIVVNNKTEFVPFQWDGTTPIDSFLRAQVNQIAWMMNKTPANVDLASAIGKSGNFTLEDPMPPMPVAPR